MGLFSQPRGANIPTAAQQPPVEQAVIVSFTLPGDDSAGHVPAIARLERRLRFTVWLHRAGELDGNVLGPDEVQLFAYGPDADRLFTVMEPALRRFPARPAHATLRYGTAGDPHARERQVEL